MEITLALTVLLNIGICICKSLYHPRRDKLTPDYFIIKCTLSYEISRSNMP